MLSVLSHRVFGIVIFIEKNWKKGDVISSGLNPVTPVLLKWGFDIVISSAGRDHVQ